MNLFEVYNQYEIEPVKGIGPYVYDSKGNQYLDFYGGHAVISVGHSHPAYVERITDQLKQLGFYSNAVLNSLQQEYADKLASISGLSNYDLFMCNSGAEANENALKLASFHNGKTKILALRNGFHGRTSAAVRVTDNSKIQAPINQGFDVEYLDINDSKAFEEKLSKKDVCAVIIEAIQGIGGCHVCSEEFLLDLSSLCRENGAVLIMDEVQCGFGRSGKFFAFQSADFRPDVISMAKGMGNGFPMGGILINMETFESRKGILGSTFGGNHLGCAAGLAVLEIIEEESLIKNAEKMGSYLRQKLNEALPGEVEILGKGLMMGLKLKFDSKTLRSDLLYNEKIFTGSSADAHIMRILPPLSIIENHIDFFVSKLSETYNKVSVEPSKI